MKKILFLIAIASSLFADDWYFAQAGAEKCQKLKGLTALQAVFSFGCNSKIAKSEQRINMAQKGMYMFDCYDKGLLLFGKNQTVCNKILED